MKCLKLFRNLILSFALVFLSGCVSGTNNILPKEKVPEHPAELFVGEKLDKQLISLVPVEENAPIDSAVVDSVQWIVPELENIPTVLLLPKVCIKEKVVTSNLSPEYYGFHNIDLRITDRELKTEQLKAEEGDLKIESVPIHKAVNKSNNEPIQTIPASLKNDVIEETEEGFVITEQEIEVLVSDKIKITLPGSGWIYLPDRENSSLNYSGREFADKNTIYTFKPGEAGEFVLNFQYQDLIKNIYKKEKIHLIVYSELSQSASKAASLDTPVESPEDSAPDDSAPDDSAPEDSAPVDLNVLLKNYLAEKNVEGIFNMVPDLVRSTNSEIRGLLPKTAELLYSFSRFVPTALILETLLLDKNYTASKDRFLYLLGKTYEADSPVRNELISADYYKQLMDTYPASIYWDESQDRYRFLKRRYIDIR